MFLVCFRFLPSSSSCFSFFFSPPPLLLNIGIIFHFFSFLFVLFLFLFLLPLSLLHMYGKINYLPNSGRWNSHTMHLFLMQAISRINCVIVKLDKAIKKDSKADYTLIPTIGAASGTISGLMDCCKERMLTGFVKYVMLALQHAHHHCDVHFS